jgi:hypothetical protein
MTSGFIRNEQRNIYSARETGHYYQNIRGDSLKRSMKRLKVEDVTGEKCFEFKAFMKVK